MIIEFSKNSEINVKRLSTDNGLKYPKLLEIVNSILDWENSIFPTRINLDPATDELHSVQDRKIFGETPVLKPGWSFNYLGQELVFIDEDTLAILDSESGIFGLVRALSHILAEYKISHRIGYLQNIDTLYGPKYNFNHLTKLAEFWGDICILDLDEVTYDMLQEIDINREEQNDWKRISLPISIKDFISTLSNDNEWIYLKVTAGSVLLFPVIVSINPYLGVCIYNEDDIVDEEIAKSIILTYIAKKYTEKKNNSN
jgi:hypothetical protein